jgi:hypothetical protein
LSRDIDNFRQLVTTAFSETACRPRIYWSGRQDLNLRPLHPQCVLSMNFHEQ